MYKNLFYRETLEPTNYSDSYYTIKDLFDFVTGENTKTKDYHHLKHKLNNFYDGYNNNNKNHDHKSINSYITNNNHNSIIRII